MKKKVLLGILAAVAVAVLGLGATSASAQNETQLWSVFVHLQYEDGTSYEVPLRRGVPNSEVVEVLQDCGRSHRTGSVVRYHCYPVPD